MARSMTGFGAARRVAGDCELVVEVRSVNSKTCDVKVRLPRDLAQLEARVQSVVRAAIHRGRVDVSVDLADAPQATRTPRLNLPLARGYLSAQRELAAALGIDATPSLDLIWTAPGVLEPPARELGPATSAALDEALSAALNALQATRATEGAALTDELTRLTTEYAALISAIQAAVPRAHQQRRARLDARLQELLGDVALDPVRLAQEVALMADRADVTEELARLDAHLAQIRAQLGSSEPSGRRLEFLLQEVHRETNTIGSKAATAEIAHQVVEAKSVLERLREQVQNVE